MIHYSLICMWIQHIYIYIYIYIYNLFTEGVSVYLYIQSRLRCFSPSFLQSLKQWNTCDFNVSSKKHKFIQSYPHFLLISNYSHQEYIYTHIKACASSIHTLKILLFLYMLTTIGFVQFFSYFDKTIWERERERERKREREREREAVLNSISFSYTGCHITLKKVIQTYYLLIRGTDGLMPFSRALAQSEMQVSSSIWAWLTEFISYDGNRVYIRENEWKMNIYIYIYIYEWRKN